jgi:hypothetical protein
VTKSPRTEPLKTFLCSFWYGTGTAGKISEGFFRKILHLFSLTFPKV